MPQRVEIVNQHHLRSRIWHSQMTHSRIWHSQPDSRQKRGQRSGEHTTPTPAAAWPNPGVWKYEPIPSANGVVRSNAPYRKNEPGPSKVVRFGRGVAGGTGAQLPLRGRRCVAPPAALRAKFSQGRRLFARVVLRTAALRRWSRALSVVLRVNTSPRSNLLVSRVCVCTHPRADAGPFFCRNFISRGIGIGQNKPWLPTPDPKPTPAWLCGAMRQSRAITKKRTIYQAPFFFVKIIC